MTPADRLLDSRLMRNLVEFMHSTARGNRDAEEAFSRLGLVDGVFLERMQLGFAGALFSRAIPKRGGVRDILAGLGVLGSHGEEHLRGSLIVPIKDLAGGFIGFTAIAPDRVERICPTGASLMGVNLPGLAEPSVVFTDSVLKAVLLSQAGVRGAVPCGETLSQQDCAVLDAHHMASAIFLGENPALLRLLRSRRISCLRLTLDFPCTLERASQAIRKAEPIKGRRGPEARGRQVKISKSGLVGDGWAGLGGASLVEESRRVFLPKSTFHQAARHALVTEGRLDRTSQMATVMLAAPFQEGVAPR